MEFDGSGELTRSRIRAIGKAVRTSLSQKAGSLHDEDGGISVALAVLELLQWKSEYQKKYLESYINWYVHVDSRVDCRCR